MIFPDPGRMAACRSFPALTIWVGWVTRGLGTWLLWTRREWRPWSGSWGSPWWWRPAQGMFSSSTGLVQESGIWNTFTILFPQQPPPHEWAKYFQGQTMESCLGLQSGNLKDLQKFTFWTNSSSKKCLKHNPQQTKGLERKYERTESQILNITHNSWAPGNISSY